MLTNFIKVDLAHSIKVDGKAVSSILVRGLTVEEIKQVRRSAHTHQKRGMAFCGVATGLPRAAVLQFEQADIEAVFRAEVACRDRDLAIDPVLAA